MTAGNSTPLTDGASVVLLSSEEWASSHGHEPLAFLRASETAAVDYVHGGEGLLMAPAYAVPRMLAREGLTLQDFDFYEVHEAFASQVLATLKAWDDPVFCKQRLGLDEPLGAIDRSKLNVNGSSLAAGHPFAATGGRIVNVAAKLLAQKGSGPRADLDLRRRRPGRRGDPRALRPSPLVEEGAQAPVASATSSTSGPARRGERSGDHVLLHLVGADLADDGYARR